MHTSPACFCEPIVELDGALLDFSRAETNGRTAPQSSLLEGRCARFAHKGIQNSVTLGTGPEYRSHRSGSVLYRSQLDTSKPKPANMSCVCVRVCVCICVEPR